jgi:hypothetical protein
VKFLLTIILALSACTDEEVPDVESGIAETGKADGTAYNGYGANVGDKATLTALAECNKNGTFYDRMKSTCDTKRKIAPFKCNDHDTIVANLKMTATELKTFDDAAEDYCAKCDFDQCADYGEVYWIYLVKIVGAETITGHVIFPKPN